jgi:SAM-dependent methyltransferase
MLSFLCNICGLTNTIELLQQEDSSCAGCGSNVRLRALIYLLSTELFGDALVLHDFPRLPGIKGLGLSDQANYAVPLASKFDYTNTYYDREPRLDIAAAHPDRYGSYDFILSSDVFEHIEAPVERAFDEAFRLLKPHGVLCLSVPFSLASEKSWPIFPACWRFPISPTRNAKTFIWVIKLLTAISMSWIAGFGFRWARLVKSSRRTNRAFKTRPVPALYLLVHGFLARYQRLD